MDAASPARPSPPSPRPRPPAAASRGTGPPVPGSAVRWIETRPALEALVQELSGCDVVALDTEANSLHAYREQVCVVQVSAGGESAILDPLALEDLSPLRDALDSDRVEVVFHGGDYDIGLLARDHGFRFRRIFDTMIAATLLGEERVGLGDLVREAFGVELDKRFQRADWKRRPLTPQHLDYLHRDTAYLPALRDLFRGRLVAADLLEEAEIEFRRVASRRARPAAFDPDGWRRIKGSARLDAAGRAVLSSLHAWREQEAMRRDVPPFKVVGPRTLLGVAERPPRRARGPEDLPGLAPSERQRHGRAVLEAVRHGLALAEAGRAPPRVPAPTAAPEGRDAAHARRTREEALRAWRRGEADARGVPPVVVLPNPALEAIAADPPADVEALERIADLGPKRVRRYGRTIVALANGRPLAEGRVQADAREDAPGPSPDAGASRP